MAVKRFWDPYKGRDPREIPTYAPFEVARYLQIPERTIHNWAFGYGVSGNAARRAKPVICAASGEPRLLSFVNVLEVHVLNALRRQHKVDLPAIRNAVEWSAKEFRTEHPLADLDIQTNGVTVFVERYGKLIDASKQGQYTMHRLLDLHLARIDRDPRGLAVRLFPFVRAHANAEPSPDEPRVVALDPRVQFGRPVLVNSRIPTLEIAEKYKAGDSIEALAEDYERSSEEIQEASGANLGSTQRKSRRSEPTFLVDECMGKSVATRLRGAGAIAHWMPKLCGQGADDVIRLRTAKEIRNPRAMSC